ncbi:MAG: hypothetical protein QW063_00420 [Candidatus Nanoarchaeia archaeon]
MPEFDETTRRIIYAKYRKKIEEEVGQSPDIKAEPEASYSEAYQIFRKEQLSLGHTLFERLCNGAERVLQLKLKQADIEKILPALEMAHIATTPQGVYALAVLTTIASFITSFAIGLVLGSIWIILLGSLVAAGLFFYIPTLPKKMFLAWRAKASDQIILAVLYMIIYMEHTPNLELATWFAAKHLPPPLSLDFIKVLWDVETKKYSSLIAALEDYIESWRGWDDAFIDSIHILQTSLAVEAKSERLKILEKAEEVILEGTYDKMLAFAHNLQGPAQTLHMLGTVLPIMGLVMLPMVSAFMGATIKWWYLVILYNILLPIAVYGIAKSILTVRPAGANPTDVYLHLAEKYAKPTISPLIIGIAIFAAISAPAFFYFTVNFPTGAAAFSLLPLLFSTLFVAAAGISISAYYWYKSNALMKIKKKILQIEDQFAAAIFQLGNKVAEGVPVEAAITYVVEAMPKAEVADFFRIIDRNMRELGMNLKDAIFDERKGALAAYPSAIIKSVMQTTVEAAKKSPEVAASSLITISRYLTNAHRVNERLKDLLADTISSLSMQTKLFAPVISGIVVGLSSLTTAILFNLGEKLKGFEVSGEMPGFGAGLLQIFQIEHMLPAWQFQFIVGIYLLQLVALTAILLNGIINGPDKLEQEDMMAKSMLYATVFYASLTALASLLFLNLVSGIVEVIV